MEFPLHLFIDLFLKESIFQNPSPIKRRESTPLLEKIKTDVSLVKQKLNNWKKETKPKEVKEEPQMVKYIKSQVNGLVYLINVCRHSFTKQWLKCSDIS